VLQVLANKSRTLGWDVLVGYNAEAVNDLFAQQFVMNFRENQNLPPINQTLDIAGVQVEFQELMLGPPLIAFSTDLSAQEAVVTMDFLSGRIVLYGSNGPIQYVTGYQDVAPGDQYQLQMHVELQQVCVEVNQRQVVAKLQDASNFSANLLSGTGSAAFLGQFFQSLFQKETQGELSYALGTLNIGSQGDLIPVSFEIRTQPAPGGSPGGAVLLLVATTYNRNGGSLPGSDFPYLLPDSFGAFLLVASQTLFQNIIGPNYAQQSGHASFTVARMSGTSPASYLTLSGGSINAGTVKGSWSSGGGIFHYYWSGTRGGVHGPGYQPVTFGFSGLKVEPQSDQMVITWSSQFTQKFSAQIVGPKGGSTSSNSVTLSVSANLSATPRLGSSTGQADTITFSGSGSPSISFDHSSWLDRFLGNGDIRDAAASTIARAAEPIVSSILNFPLPAVDTFAVSSLFFPAQNVLKYSAVYMPGDLALFGQVQPSQTAFTIAPLQSVVGPGGTVQFGTSSGESVTWTRFPLVGTLSSAGLYTAPALIPRQAAPVGITATDPNGDVATAIVVLVPSPVAVSPAFVLVDPSSQPPTFSAAVLGEQEVTWSLSPSDGSVGSIDTTTGVYTPPATFPSGIATATITASTSAGSATALVLLNNAIIAFGVSPTLTALGPAGTCNFSDGTAGGGSNQPWRVIGVGSITPKGAYTAPESLAAAITDLVILEGGESSLFGFAVVALDPALT
jgi:hypothetical protein